MTQGFDIEIATAATCKESLQAAEVVTTPPFRPITEDDMVWCRKADAVSRQYQTELHRIAGSGATEFEIGLVKMSVTEFPRAVNRSFLTAPFMDPGGWLIAAFQIFGSTYHHETWMSICPMELQSHVNPIRWARGRVLVFGLGMGYFLREILKKRSVKEVVVIERERDAIRMYDRLFGRNPRVKFLLVDAFRYEDDSEYDFAYVDIWREMDDAKNDMPKLVPRFKAQSWAYWGMERALVEGAASPPNVNKFSELVKRLSCPVTLAQARDIAELICRLVPDKEVTS